MREYRVLLTWEAIYDVTEIIEYIEEEFGMERADRFANDIEREIEKLGYSGAALPRTQFFYRGYSIHKKLYPPSVIFYIFMEDCGEIHVLRVLREEQEQMRILGKNQEYTYPEDSRYIVGKPQR